MASVSVIGRYQLNRFSSHHRPANDGRNTLDRLHGDATGLTHGVKGLEVVSVLGLLHHDEIIGHKN